MRPVLGERAALQGREKNQGKRSFLAPQARAQRSGARAKQSLRIEAQNPTPQEQKREGWEPGESREVICGAPGNCHPFAIMFIGRCTNSLVLGNIFSGKA
jgi:hypothetical protein